MELQPDLEFTASQAERVLQAWLGTQAACRGVQRLKGGLVNTVLRLDFDQPPYRAVVKLHTSAGNRFAAEARALRFLRSETACPVPRVYAEDGSQQLIPYTYLLIEHLPGRCLDGLDMDPAARAGLEGQLAAVLGELHAHQRTWWGGLDQAAGSASWPDVFMGRLLGVRSQARLAERLGPEVLGLVDEAIRYAPALLADPGAPTLVHGDIWDGNLLVQEDGDGWRLSGVLDPDAQFADVEYELAYLEVFDGQRDAFFTAYRRKHALRRGYEQRRLVYWLYTALVHVALFDDQFFREFTARTAASIRRPGVI